MNHTKKTTLNIKSQDSSIQNGKHKLVLENTIVLSDSSDSIAKTSENPTIDSSENLIQLGY